MDNKEIYTERISCIFCKSNNFDCLFKDDTYNIPLGCYTVNTISNKNFYNMPFNILKCKDCFTYQTKFLGNMDIIYDYNALSHGTIRSTMDTTFANFITDDKIINNIKNIIEIGGGNGGLSDIILENCNNINYTIIDPTYSGTNKNKTIIKDYLEKISFEKIVADTVVMSHVFEHFYEPTEILNNFKNNKNIKHIYLNFPNLESYIKNNNYHVLNPEHIYYVNNQFIINLFQKYGFCLEKTYYHEEHSVLFSFKRNDTYIDDKIINNTSDEVIQFFDNIQNKIKSIVDVISKNMNNKVYIWPCSMHTTYLLSLGLEKQIKLDAILDNAPHKINKYLYGFKYKCLSFNEILNKNENSIIILNGGCYNIEVINNNKNNSNIIFI